MPEQSVVVRLIANVAPYTAGMRQAQAATQRTAVQAGRLSTGVRQAGTSMAGAARQAGLLGGLVSPITAVGAATVGTVKAAIDWESAWAGVTKTVDGSEKQMAGLQSELRNMAKELPATHAEIAAVAEAAGALGVRREDIAGFTRTMIDLGETTDLSSQMAANGLARLMNIMGTAGEDVDRLGSTLVALGNDGASTEAEILELSTRLAAAGKIAGLSESDVLAFASAVTSVGVQAEAGGTALSKTFTAMRDAVLSGGEALDTFAEVAGTTAEDFARAFREDPARAISDFIAGLGRMNDAGLSTSGVFDELGLADQRLMRALLSTAEAGDLLTDSIESANEEWRENTALTEEAAERYDTMAAQFTVAWNNVKDAAIDAGEAIAPVAVTIAEAAAGVSGFLAEANRQLQDFSGTFEGTGNHWERIMNVFRGGAEDAEGATESFITRLREATQERVPAFLEQLAGSDEALSAFGINVGEIEEEVADLNEEIDRLTGELFETGREAIELEEHQYALAEAIVHATEVSQSDTASKEDQRDALRAVAEQSLDLIENMVQQGATTDQVATKTRNARQDFLDAADAMGIDADKAKKLADKYGLIPGRVATDVDIVNYWRARARIAELRRQWAAIQDKSVTITINSVAGFNPGPVSFGRAEGAYVRYMQAGGMLSPSRAEIVPPNTFRVIGDRAAGDEAFIPIDNSARSRAILARTAEEMGFALMAGGGMVGRPIPAGSFGAGPGGTGGGRLVAGEFTGNLFLDSGEFLGVVSGVVAHGVREGNRDLKRTVLAGKEP